MKISIITTTFNSASTVRNTIESILSQDFKDIELIIIDGKSKDNTLDIVNEYRDQITTVISAPDKGIYDAMNKGIQMATGNIVGMLNSDDFFTSPNILSTVVKTFQENDNIDAVYGDIHFVNSNDLTKCIRYYSSSIFHPLLFRFGFMPAHPSFYVKRECYEKYGLYDISYKIASDYDLLIRFLFVHKISYKYLKEDFVTMRTGGISTQSLNNRILLNREIIRACKRNGIYTNMFLLSLKYIYKIFELKH